MKLYLELEKGKKYHWKEWLTIYANEKSYTPYQDYIDILKSDFNATNY
jgi:hypothetical protein